MLKIKGLKKTIVVKIVTMLQFRYLDITVISSMTSDNYLNDVLLKKAILEHITSGKYRLTKHAAEEQAKDGIDLQDTLDVLRMGTHEKEKTLFDNVFQTWKYAIRGKTEDLKNVRIIIAFSTEMMIITVMELK